MNTQRLRAWVKLDKQKKNLNIELTDLEHQMQTLEDGLIEDMANDGIESIKIDQRTVYINTRIWAKYGTAEKAIGALKEAEMHEFVNERFSVQSLSSFVSECVKENKPLPEAFKGIIEPIEKHRLRVRKS